MAPKRIGISSGFFLFFFRCPGKKNDGEPLTLKISSSETLPECLMFFSFFLSLGGSARDGDGDVMSVTSRKTRFFLRPRKLTSSHFCATNTLEKNVREVVAVGNIPLHSPSVPRSTHNRPHTRKTSTKRAHRRPHLQPNPQKQTPHSPFNALITNELALGTTDTAA
jgi:hypothetical protein